MSADFEKAPNTYLDFSLPARVEINCKQDQSMSDDFRLSDLIVSALDEDKVSTILRLVAEVDDLSDQDKARSLVMSGVALGAEEALTRILTDTRSKESFLSQVIEALDDALDNAPNLETSTALADIRKLVAGELSKILQAKKDAFAARAYIHLGLGPELALATESGNQYDRLDLIAIGAELFRRVPQAMYGWHHGRTAGYPEQMKCRCVSCHEELFKTLQPTSEEIALRRTVADSGGMDNAFADFAAAVIDDLRQQLATMEAGNTNLHDIDPGDSLEQYQKIINKLKQ